MEKYKFFLCGVATLIENRQTVKYFLCINLIHNVKNYDFTKQQQQLPYFSLKSKNNPVISIQVFEILKLQSPV